MFFTENYTVYTAKPREFVKGKSRISGGETVDGVYIEPKEYTKSTMELNCQPDEIGDFDIQKVAELKGRDESGLLMILSDNKLPSFSQITSTKGMLIAYQGSIYEVFASGSWTSHYESKAILKKETIAEIEANTDQVN